MITLRSFLIFSFLFFSTQALTLEKCEWDNKKVFHV